MDRKLNFGTVGCGRISGTHLNVLTQENFPGRVVAVTDIDEAKAKAASEKFGGLPYYTDYHEMMRQHPEIDVVNVLTPSGYHARHVIDLAQYGKHIITEKPMALTVADCRAMQAACKKNKCRLFVVKQNRFNPGVVAAREALDSGRLGKLVMGTVRVRWCRRQDYYESDNWHGTWELDGGVMSQQASHHLDLLQWFLGPVESVQCRTATRLLDIEVEDTAAAILTFQSGAIGIFEATVATRPENLEGSLSLLGEKGTVVIGGQAVNQMVYWKFEDQRPEDENILKNFSQSVPSVYGKGHGPYIAHVIDAIVNKKPALVEGPEGEKNIKILTALYESAARGGAKLKPGCRITHSKLGKPS